MNILKSTLFSAIVLLNSPVVVMAHPGGHLPPIDKNPGVDFGQEVEIPETQEGILNEIAKQQGLIEKALKSKDLSKARMPAISIKLLSHELWKREPSANQISIQESATAIDRLCIEVTKSSGAGALKATKQNVAQLNQAIANLRLQMGRN